MVWYFAGMHSLLYILHIGSTVVFICVYYVNWYSHSIVRERVLHYCIVLGKRPWALTAQVRTKNWWWVVAWRSCLNGSTILCKDPPQMQSWLLGGTELTCIIASSVLPWCQPDRGESCIMLQSGPTCSLVAKFPRCSVFACSMQISCCRGRTLQQGANCWCLMSCHPKCIRTIAAMWLSRPTFGFTQI